MSKDRSVQKASQVTDCIRIFNLARPLTQKTPGKFFRRCAPCTQRIPKQLLCHCAGRVVRVSGQSSEFRVSDHHFQFFGCVIPSGAVFQAKRGISPGAATYAAQTQCAAPAAASLVNDRQPTTDDGRRRSLTPDPCPLSFCISCAPAVDISPPHFPTFFLRSSDRNKTTVISRSNDAPFSLRFIGVNPRKSAAKVFLKCTKNTELTVARFTRTVTFALLQKTSSCSGRKPV